MFEANTSELTEESKEKLKALLPELKGKPHRIDVRGHAVSDGQANQSFSLDAYQISYQRALITMGYLVEAGVEPNRIRFECRWCFRTSLSGVGSRLSQQCSRRSLSTR